MGEDKQAEIPQLSIRRINARLWEEFRVEAVRRGITTGELLNLVLRERYGDLVAQGEQKK